MSPVTRPLSLEARLLVRLGFVLWLVALLASVWEVLALQPPDSPLHAGVLAGPIAQLAAFAFVLGSGALVVALLWPTLYREGEGRWVASLLAAGAVVHVLSLTVSASRGLLAVQLLDPRADARWLLYARGFGMLLTALALGSLLARACRRGVVT